MGVLARYDDSKDCLMHRGRPAARAWRYDETSSASESESDSSEFPGCF